VVVGQRPTTDKLPTTAKRKGTLDSLSQTLLCWPLINNSIITLLSPVADQHASQPFITAY